MRLLQTTGLVFFLLLSGWATAETIALNPDRPDEYVVKKGDTLWGISSNFLRDPWRWPDVWDFNPQIDDPHLIYPGDIIVLNYGEGGQPVLRVKRRTASVSQTTGGGEAPPGQARTTAPPADTFKRKPGRVVSAVGTRRISPKVRSIRSDRAIPTIPLDVIRQFLSKPLVISEREMNDSPYVVAGEDGHLIAGAGDTVYARGISAGKTNRFNIYRTGKAYQNPGARRDDILGYEAIHVGSALVKSFGDPSTLQISQSERETLIGDKLIPVLNAEPELHFIPHAPSTPIEGNIIELIDAVSRIGQYQTAVLNVGEFDGMEVGHVLAIYRKGDVIRDDVSPDPRDKVKLPDTRSGLVMIFRTFDRVSYGLVMTSETDIRLYDLARNP